MAVEAPPAPKAKAGRHAAAPGPFRPGPIGWAGRGVVYALVAYAVLYLAQINPDVAGRAAGAVTFAIVGLSLNIIIGYTGQLSLGHQGFFGVGAFTAAYVSFNSELGQPRDVPFPVAILAAMVMGAAFALLLGVVALRITGLYLSLITLVFGLTLEVSLFEQEDLTGGGAGAQVERPEFFFENSRYYFLCLAILAVVVYIDWRLTRTKTGRALLALRENERVAAAFGVNVTAFKLLAFVLSGALAGLAGALFVYNLGSTSSGDYNFFLGLTFVLMIVVGGLNSRVGVILGSVFF